MITLNISHNHCKTGPYQPTYLGPYYHPHQLRLHRHLLAPTAFSCHSLPRPRSVCPHVAVHTLAARPDCLVAAKSRICHYHCQFAHRCGHTDPPFPYLPPRHRSPLRCGPVHLGHRPNRVASQCAHPLGAPVLLVCRARLLPLVSTAATQLARSRRAASNGAGRVEAGPRALSQT